MEKNNTGQQQFGQKSRIWSIFPIANTIDPVRYPSKLNTNSTNFPTLAVVTWLSYNISREGLLACITQYQYKKWSYLKFKGLLFLWYWSILQEFEEKILKKTAILFALVKALIFKL